jgi:oligopeptide/dipeptide ABC transporter ATP-binding protein
MTDPDKILLRVENLVKHFPIRYSRSVVHAVNGVSFEVSAGKTLALVGESGSGKTTVGRCILKLLEVTSGQITFEDVDLVSTSQREFRQHRSRFQMVFQEPYGSLNPRMNVQQIIEENLILVGKLDRPQRRKRVLELLDVTHLPRGVLNNYPHELTGGQQQRVAIARAISTNPDLVVLDEPTSELDITVRAEIINLLRALQNEIGIAYLFISHDLTAVKEISHHVAIMYLGEIIEVAPNPQIFTYQLHPYSQALLASVLFPDPNAVYSDVILKGEIPSPVDLPSGCYLHPRCPFAEPVCSVEHPDDKSFPDGRITFCHFASRFVPHILGMY